MRLGVSGGIVCGHKMAVFNLVHLWPAIILGCAASVGASEICIYGDRYKVCDHGCCSNDCCMSPYQIAGMVFGALAVVCVIAAFVLYCVKRHKRKSRVVSDAHPRVVMVNGYSQPMAYSTTQPFAPGYASSYGHPGVPPPYAAQSVLPPQYGYGGFPAQPPPAYTGYNDEAAKNPFYVAAFNAASPDQGQGHSSGSANPGAM